MINSFPSDVTHCGKSSTYRSRRIASSAVHAGASADASVGPAEVREYCLPARSRHLQSPAVSEAGSGTHHRRPFDTFGRASLEDAPEMETHHLAEAIQYRPRRQIWSMRQCHVGWDATAWR